MLRKSAGREGKMRERLRVTGHCSVGSEHVEAQADGQREYVFHPDVPVLYGRNQIEIAGAQFVIERNASIEPAAFGRDAEGGTLPDKEVGAYLCGKSVVAFGVTRGFGFPEVFSENGTEKDAGGERGQLPGCAGVKLPWNVTFLQCEGRVTVGGVEAGYNPQQEVGFPVVLFPVVPSGAEGDDADAPCELRGELVGDEPVPGAAIAQQAVGIDRMLVLQAVRLHCSVVCMGICGEKAGNAGDDVNNVPLHKYSSRWL